ncbi:MAG TPA: hypothetical protein VMW90_02375 [Acidobacteriota bacterium]|nr:hypothetical protein [Acidobacteriota bacterium]
MKTRIFLFAVAVVATFGIGTVTYAGGHGGGSMMGGGYGMMGNGQGIMDLMEKLSKKQDEST